MTSTASDVTADMLLSSVVQCVQKLVKLIRRLATQHRQQILILSKRYQLRINDIPLVWVKDIGLIKFTDEPGILDIHSVDKIHVMLPDSSRVNKSFIKI